MMLPSSHVFLEKSGTEDHWRHYRCREWTSLSTLVRNTLPNKAGILFLHLPPRFWIKVVEFQKWCSFGAGKRKKLSYFLPCQNQTGKKQSPHGIAATSHRLKSSWRTTKPRFHQGWWRYVFHLSNLMNHGMPKVGTTPHTFRLDTKGALLCSTFLCNLHIWLLAWANSALFCLAKRYWIPGCAQKRQKSRIYGRASTGLIPAQI